MKAAPPDLGAAARHYAAQDYPAAASVCRDIIDADARHFDALHLLGVVLSRQGRHAEAVPYLQRAAAERADNAQLQCNLCTALLALQQAEPAMIACRRALALAPADPDVLNNLGLAHKALGQTQAAIDAFRQVTTLCPDNTQAWFNLAVVLGDVGQPEQALVASRTALLVAPPDLPVPRLADITAEVGRSLMALGQPEAALAVCKDVLQRHPDQAVLRWNMSLAHLLLGRFAEGWPGYESRWLVPQHEPRPDATYVLDPARISSQHVLILAEQGRGDTLQCVRYAGLLCERGARVSLQVYPNLVDLLAAMPGIDQVVSTDSASPAADLRTTVMSLPLAFDTRLETIPATVPYLVVPDDRLAVWQSRLGPRHRLRVGLARRLRIGLAWSGSRESYGRAAMPAAALAPLLRLPGIDFHCLQKDIIAGDRAWLTQSAPQVVRHDNLLHDFADTAALVALMDGVVTIDTAVAHLAGALARPLCVMLPFSPDWRWLLHRDDSPWYPTARLFRQPARDAWDAVVQAVAAFLSGGASEWILGQGSDTGANSAVGSGHHG